MLPAGAEYNLVWSCVAGGLCGVKDAQSSSGPVGVPKDLHAASVVVGIDAEEMKGEDDERSARGGSK